MAEFGWRGDRSLREWLFAEGYRFDFTQAIRLLEILGQRNPADAPVEGYAPLGSGPDPDREAARLRAKIGFGFPPREVATVDAPRQAEPATLTANFFALAGGRAPLPDWVAELALQAERNHDTGLRDFLDLFHHRLLSLLYRLRLHHRPWLDPSLSQPSFPAINTAPKRAGNPMSNYLLSLMGLHQAELRGRMAIGDEELLPYAGLFWQKPRSAVGLQRILQHALGVPVAIQEHIGVWRPIEPEDRTCIGRSTRGPRAARNHSLGHSTVLGRRVWDAQGRIDIALGPLRYQQFEDFFPRNAGYARISALVRFYCGEMLDVHLELRLAPGEASALRLQRARLSRTAWLRPGAQRERSIHLPLLPAASA
jgi:type VI secretion system protein ImpH